MSTGKATVTATGNSSQVKKRGDENYTTITVVPTPGATPYAGLTFTVEATIDGTNFEQVAVVDNRTGLLVSGGTSVSPSDGTARTYVLPIAQNYTGVRVNVSAISAGSADFLVNSSAIEGSPLFTSIAGAAGSFTNITASGTLAVTGNATGGGSILSSSPSGGVGYTTGAGGTVTQATSRTTGVTLNTVSGAITLVSAAGSATPASFTVTNSRVGANDTVIASVKSGTDKRIVLVTAVAAGSFEITTYTTGGTTTEQPVINFTVVKGAVA